MAILTAGGGDRGLQLNVSFTPDATLKAEIDALVAAGTKVIGKVIKITTGANYECTSPADGEVAHGRIIDYRPTTTSYRLTVELWFYTNGAGTVLPVTRIVNAEYETEPSLGETVLVDGSTYRPLKGDASGGVGFVIGVDTPGTGRFDFLM